MDGMYPNFAGANIRVIPWMVCILIMQGAIIRVVSAFI
jgi:hypothetical protein